MAVPVLENHFLNLSWPVAFLSRALAIGHLDCPLGGPRLVGVFGSSILLLQLFLCIWLLKFFVQHLRLVHFIRFHSSELGTVASGFSKLKSRLSASALIMCTLNVPATVQVLIKGISLDQNTFELRLLPRFHHHQYFLDWFSHSDSTANEMRASVLKTYLSSDISDSI